jgi:hypothetical protein
MLNVQGMCRTRSENRIEGSDGLPFGHSREIAVRFRTVWDGDGDGIWMLADNFSKHPSRICETPCFQADVRHSKCIAIGMKQAIWRTVLFLILTGALPNSCSGDAVPVIGSAGSTRSEDFRCPSTIPNYSGKPLSYWLKSIRTATSDGDGIRCNPTPVLRPLRSSGSDPLVVSEPFTPIEVGVDGYVAVIQKLLRHLHPLECSGLSGCDWPAAAPSAPALAEWALTPQNDFFGYTQSSGAGFNSLILWGLMLPNG